MARPGNTFNEGGVVLMPLPNELALTIKEFMLDKRRGNIILHIRDGKILGFKTEEFHAVASQA